MVRQPVIGGNIGLQHEVQAPTMEENVLATRIAVDQLVQTLANVQQQLAVIETHLAATDQRIADVKDTVVQIGKATAYSPSGRSLITVVDSIFATVGAK